MDPSVVSILNCESIASQSYPQTVEELMDRVRRKLVPPDVVIHERLAFGKLRQGATPYREFLSKFESSAAYLTDMTWYEYKIRFIEALSPELQDEVLKHYAEVPWDEWDILKIQRYLLQVADVVARGRAPSVRRFFRSGPPHDGEGNDDSPDDLEDGNADHGLNAIDASKARCFMCFEVGHLRRDCPKLRSRHAGRGTGETESRFSGPAFGSRPDSSGPRDKPRNADKRAPAGPAVHDSAPAAAAASDEFYQGRAACGQ
eukprot:jgi/Mesvir1/10783/Mv25437-RA.1